jgi:hypothetical protein
MEQTQDLGNKEPPEAEVGKGSKGSKGGKGGKGGKGQRKRKQAAGTNSRAKIPRKAKNDGTA